MVVVGVAVLDPDENVASLLHVRFGNDTRRYAGYRCAPF
jgi:hypothetical protein